MKCTECGFTIWSKYSETIGAHVECISEDKEETLELESRLDKALEVE